MKLQAQVSGMPSILIIFPLLLSTSLLAQGPPRVEALIDAVRPGLPFPPADDDRELPAPGGSQAKWFVVWPGERNDRRIHVKANPLHPDTQAAGTAAMARIQEAVERAERKAQAAYDRALEELKRTGKPTDLDGVTLDDEGIEGERIDAELELTIDLNTGAQSFDIGSSVAPTAAPGTGAVSWIIRTAPNAYRAKSASATREHFRAAEARLLFGTAERPHVSRRDDHHFVVTVAPADGAFSVVIRGNEQLLNQVVATSDWTRLSRPQ